MKSKLQNIAIIFSFLIVTQSQIFNDEARNVFIQTFNLPDDTQRAFNNANIQTNALIDQQKQLTQSQIDYLSLLSYANANNLPKKSLIRKQDSSLFLILQSETPSPTLQIIPAPIVSNLFSANQSLMHVSSQLLLSFPQNKQQLGLNTNDNANIRLIRIADSDQIFLENGRKKMPISQQDFKDFGFDAQKVVVVADQYMLDLRNGDMLS